MPLLGVLGDAVTLAFGAFVTTTLFFTLAFPLSALVRLCAHQPLGPVAAGAFGGGLLYGFSPYLVAQGGSHLNLVFVPLPPLIFLVLAQIAAGRAGEPGCGERPGLAVARSFLSRRRSWSRRLSSAPSGSYRGGG